jgi:hypothetical protein
MVLRVMRYHRSFRVLERIFAAEPVTDSVVANRAQVASPCRLMVIIERCYDYRITNGTDADLTQVDWLTCHKITVLNGCLWAVGDCRP